jgi:hypothetical protein
MSSEFDVSGFSILRKFLIPYMNPLLADPETDPNKL